MPVSGRSHGPGSQLGSQHDLWLRRLAAQALGETAAEGARMMAETGRTRAAAAAAHHNHNHSHQAGSTGASIAARCGASFGGSFGSFGANAQREAWVEVLSRTRVLEGHEAATAAAPAPRVAMAAEQVARAHVAGGVRQV